MEVEVNTIRIFLKSLSLLLVMLNLYGCNPTEFETIAKGSDEGSGATGESFSNISFSGIDSIDNITHFSARLNWTHMAGASVYQVFSVSGGVISYIATVAAPTATYTLTGLTAGASLIYRVRSFDSQGKMDSNTNNVTVNILNAPPAPSSITLTSPAVNFSDNATPTFLVGGISSGETIKLFTDSSCTTQVGSAVSASSTVSITTSTLSQGTKTIYANATVTNASACSTANATYIKAPCPTGYIAVPSNTTVGAANNFCVMKYEAKAWNDANTNDVIDGGEIDADGCNEGGCTTANWGLATYKPSSTAQGAPWRRINQINSWAECDSLNSEFPTRADIDSDTGSDGTYALISNPEWMTIARNVENIDSNWTSGTVGTGCLKIGNVGGTNACAGGNSGYNGPDPDLGSGRTDNGTAQLTLNNGSVIWDLSGNVWEWTDWTLGSPLSTNMASGDKAYVSADGAPIAGFREYTQVDTFTALSPSTAILPSDSTFNANFGMGRYYSSTSGGAALRAGDWSYGINAGAFALDFF